MLLSKQTTPEILIHLKKQKTKNYQQDSNEYGDDDLSIKYTPIKSTATEISSSVKASSITLSVLLYVISSLLCLSIVLNFMFFFLTKYKRNRGKLILNHDSSDSSEQQTMKSDEIADNN